MRNWCVAVAIGALLAMPICAQQQKDNGSGHDENGSPVAAEKNHAAESSANVAPGLRGFFALPGTPRPTPFAAPAPIPADIFSDWENNPWNRKAWGRLTPRFELAGMYQYINFNPGDSFSNFNVHGGTGSFTYNASKWLGLVAEAGTYVFKRDLGNSSISSGAQSGGMSTYLFGPRLNLRKFDHFVPFGEFLVGGAHGDSTVTGASGQSAFAMAVGGGIDVVLWKNLAWRFAQLDYLLTNFSGPALGANGRQNNFRAGTGLVLRWGYPPAPPKPNHPPVAACSVNPAMVYQGSGDAVAVHVNASDADNDTLAYAYTATGGTVEGTGSDGRWNTSGLAVGSYTVNAKVDDGKGGTATCSADLKVDPKPNQPPVISCAPDRNPIMPGERTTITSTASDPDNDPLTYSYATTGGQVTGDGAKAQFDSTGLQPGSYKVTCSVSDGRGGKAEATTTVDVQQPPPPPQATKVGDCGYTKAGASRFDNLCKRVGDDVALRLKNDPTAKVVIVGYADAKEPKAAKLAETRAELAKKYLGEKGIDASRISTRAGTASTEKGMEKQNRRVDFIFVPEGATY